MGELPEGATWCGFDLSPEMVRLASERLAPFGARARVVLTDGDPRLDAPDASCDRFVSTYVLDLLSDEDIRAVIGQAERVLVPGGLLCLVGLTAGCTPASRVVTAIWSALHRLSPALVGGCRPLELAPHLARGPWKTRFHRSLSAFGVPSEILVAERA